MRCNKSGTKQISYLFTGYPMPDVFTGILLTKRPSKGRKMLEFIFLFFVQGAASTIEKRTKLSCELWKDALQVIIRYVV